jgi:hypothetical protein
VIRFSACVTAAVVTGLTWAGIFALLAYLFGWNDFPFLVPCTVAYFLGTVKMRFLANQGREDEERKHGPRPLTGQWAPKGSNQRGRWQV